MRFRYDCFILVSHNVVYNYKHNSKKVIKKHYGNLIFNFFDKVMRKDVNERVMALIAYLRMQPTEFGEKCGIPSSTISRIKNKISHPNFDTLSKIISTFEQLNSVWLMTGEGEMIKTGGNTLKEVESLVQVVKEKDEQLYVLKKLLDKMEEVDRLKNNQVAVSKTELAGTSTQEKRK